MLLSVFLTVLGQTVLEAPRVAADVSPQVGCDKLTIPQFETFHTISSESFEVRNSSLPSSPLAPGADFCNFSLTLNHHGANDVVFVSIWLPLESWNGRFLATGGGGLAAGTFASALTDPVSRGYAAGSTDAGLTGQWALNADRTINTALIENFATRSIHDMAVIGKAAVKSFYGVDPGHSYYSGCSQGGRQGYFAAQYSPGDFDGILANAPAINTPQLSPADFWPSVVMSNIATPPQCVFQRYQEAIIAGCDALDGAADGLISAPERCGFDTTKLVGENVDCADTNGLVSITKDHAVVVAKILQGARGTSGEFLWYGNPPGASFSGLANTKTENGVTVPVPFAPAEAWMRYSVAQDPDLDTASLTFAEFEDVFKQSLERCIEPLGTNGPDLTDLKKAGGKLLTWHEMADPLITHPGTTLYWDKLQKTMGGQKVLDEFYRLFLAPGAGHCSGGYGPVPVEPLSVLVDWVERGEVPDTLFAITTQNGVNVTRNLCPFPQSLRYTGQGDLIDANSFFCEG